MELIATFAGETGLRGPVGESGIKGTEGDQGNVTCLNVWGWVILKILYHNNYIKKNIAIILCITIFLVFL